MKTAMDNECMYLEIEDVTSCPCDVFDHPCYKYHCAERIKTYLSEFLIVTNVLSIITDKLT